jgi:hypothetical protein
MSGVTPTREFNDQIVRVVKQVLRAERGADGGAGTTNDRRRSMHYAIANEDIDNAANRLTDPTTGEVELLSRNSSGDLELSGVTHTVTNRWEDVSIDEDAMVVITRINGEWVPTGGGGERHQGVLLTNLAAASDAVSNPSEGTVHIMEANAAGTLVHTNRCVDVVHRFEFIAIEAGTLVRVEYVGNEWGIYSADCDNTEIPTTGCT